MPSPILEIKNLSRAVTENEQTKFIVNNISFQFYPEKIYSVIGPSGAGKSSFLRLVNRLDEPTSGDIFFKNEYYSILPPVELRKKIGYLFQTPYLFEGTVRYNLNYANENLDEKDLLKLLDEVHIQPEFLDRSVEKLSNGEKQRVAIARLLAVKPEIILLDEPTSALDPGHTRAIEKLIKEIVQKEKITAIVVTHHPEQALHLGEETLLMAHGKLVESGSAEDVINNPQSEEGMLYKAKELR